MYLCWEFAGMSGDKEYCNHPNIVRICYLIIYFFKLIGILNGEMSVLFYL